MPTPRSPSNRDGSIERLKMVPASDAVDFSFDFQDLVLKPVRDSGIK